MVVTVHPAACSEPCSAHPDIACLILTSYDDDDEALFSAIMAGAAGYVLKEIRGNDLVSAIRAVAAGQSLLSPSVTRRVLERMREGPKTDPALASLSARERARAAAVPLSPRASRPWPRRAG